MTSWEKTSSSPAKVFIFSDVFQIYLDVFSPNTHTLTNICQIPGGQRPTCAPYEVHSLISIMCNTICCTSEADRMTDDFRNWCVHVLHKCFPSLHLEYFDKLACIYVFLCWCKRRSEEHLIFGHMSVAMGDKVPPVSPANQNFIFRGNEQLYHVLLMQSKHACVCVYVCDWLDPL